MQQIIAQQSGQTGEQRKRNYDELQAGSQPADDPVALKVLSRSLPAQKLQGAVSTAVYYCVLAIAAVNASGLMFLWGIHRFIRRVPLSKGTVVVTIV